MTDGLAALRQVVDDGRHRVLSTDLFDTVLLRDHSTETQRLTAAAKIVAAELGMDHRLLARLRWEVHSSAYRAVSLVDPDGEAGLTGMTQVMARLLGEGAAVADRLREAEITVDVTHLRANRPLLALLDRAKASGMRVIAVSDTYYSTADLSTVLQDVVGPHPISEVYSSADVGATKHTGCLYPDVARRESFSPDEVVHVGDNVHVDVTRARAAGWTAVHLPRGRAHSLARLAGQLRSVPLAIRRSA